MADNCLFCKIVRQDIPAKLLYEGDDCIAFRDIDPKAPTHLLVVPREHVSSLNEAKDATLVGRLVLVAAQIATEEGIADSGYRTVFYRICATVLGGVVAALAGALMALWLRYVGPKTSLGFEVMTDILLIVVIGGMGTMYGAVVGAALFILAQNYLKTLMGQASEMLSGVPLLAAALHPDRWMLWLGVLFILSIYFFPIGIVGKLRLRRTTR